jgi:acetyl esterase/lipase
MTLIRLTGMLIPALVCLCSASALAAQERVERNVVYGMYSGLALLMDVHHPAEPNGTGVLLVHGSGFHLPTEYGAAQVKDRGAPRLLLDTGYTVFVINHRAAPRFRYPASVEDGQRAMRFIRHHARQFGVHPDRLAGWGGSSGGHLISMLGTMDGDGDPADPDPVNRLSAKPYAVVAAAAPTDFLHLDPIPFYPASAIASYVGGIAVDRETYRDASPITYVSTDDPPFLLVHGDADEVVPFHQSERMLAALRSAGVDVRLIRIAGGGHDAHDVVETVRWMNERLLSADAATALQPLLQAAARLQDGFRLAGAGDIAAALDAFRAAEAGSEKLTITGRHWDTLCRQGGLWQQAAEVMPACERAVTLLPTTPWIRDSRGIVRALLGDLPGAIADLEFALAAIPPGRPERDERQSWLAELRAGRNPFTAEVLERLRH